MPFLLYQIDPQRGVYDFVDHLEGLWRRGGPVEMLGRPAAERNGRWTLTASDLIAQLLHERPSLLSSSSHGYAILDDLVPRGPEVFYARVLEIVGCYDKGYIPFMIVMSQVLYEPPPEPDAKGSKERRPPRRQLPLEPPNAPELRSFHHLIEKSPGAGWLPSRGFAGPILTKDQWTFFVDRTTLTPQRGA